MATNPYINTTSVVTEQRLIEDLTVELIQGVGQDCFYVPRKYFNIDKTITRPREGDLIYFPLSKSLFEINFVEHENPLYPLGKLYSYQITAELFTYSYEKIQTLNSDINSPYTSTTAGLSGSVIIPIANNLGITLGVNDQLQTEGNSYGFNPNDPFNEAGCTGGS